MTQNYGFFGMYVLEVASSLSTAVRPEIYECAEVRL